jgi:hypothetical protein
MLSEQEAERTKKIDDIELMGNASSVGFAVGVETKFRLARVLVGLTIVALLAGFLLAVGLRPIVNSTSPISLPETVEESPRLS